MKSKRLRIELLEDRIALSTNFYVSPSGSDSNIGTFSQPFATIQKAYNAMTAGDTAFFRGGVYDIMSRITLDGKSGQAGNLLNFVAYQNEQPIFDFTTAAGNGAVPSGSFFRVRNIAYVHMVGFELLKNGSNPNEGRRDAITFSNVDFSIVENFDVHAFAGSGIQVVNGSHDNLIENNDVHDNIVNNNSNADGFWIGDGSHNNIVRGNRAFHNNDDGFDLWDAGSGNLYENNWAFENGKDSSGNVINGDGNGFKLGRGPGQNTLINNLTWNNKTAGFTENSNTSILTLYNNTSYSNGLGWRFESGLQDILRNNVSFQESNNFNGADDQFNTWNFPGISVFANDFVTIDDSANRGARQADGSLPVSSFLHLVQGSDLIDFGIDVGLPFNGSAPDFGAFEFSATGPALPGDYNGNNVVDSADYTVWLDSLGQSVTAFSGADGDGSGNIDQADYALWKSNFGNTLAVAASVDEQPEIASEIAEQASEDFVDIAFADFVLLGPLAMTLSGNELDLNDSDESLVDALALDNVLALPVKALSERSEIESQDSIQNTASNRDYAISLAFNELGNNLDL